MNELIEFAILVQNMRIAQDTAYRAMSESDDYSEALIYIEKAEKWEKEVDFALAGILNKEILL